MLSKSIALLSVAVVALSSVVSSQPLDTKVLIRPKNLCLLLPPKQGVWIDDYVDKAVSWCINPKDTGLTRANQIPDNFIASRHDYTNSQKNYTQVTGRIRPEKFRLHSDDDGGQNDPTSPKGAACIGYKYFVQFIEPNDQHYCLRCCQNKSDCPTDKPDRGCEEVIPGDYS
ncbi:hypothetical protein B0O80DRAFT_451098 [Mortierella sp. GBAus27b]|nr:hypothetical protein BGX31_010280 [Mortierella sp. GBA43]KAI8354447.1 hypothetical protein B0O80DRAFT_451098 [Mortierella sp. GBAus27b]